MIVLELALIVAFCILLAMVVCRFLPEEGELSD